MKHRVRRKPPELHKPAGRKARPPWESAASRAAGLPADRDAWLARVLGALATATSVCGAARALGVVGPQLRHWHRSLARMLAAGELPPSVQAIPSPTAEEQPAPPPPPKPRRGRPPKPGAE